MVYSSDASLEQRRHWHADFFVNERRHDGAYDIETLSTAVRAAAVRSVIAP